MPFSTPQVGKIGFLYMDDLLLDDAFIGPRGHHCQELRRADPELPTTLFDSRGVWNEALLDSTQHQGWGLNQFFSHDNSMPVHQAPVRCVMRGHVVRVCPRGYAVSPLQFGHT